MYVAIDSNGKRIYADDPIRYKDCFCPCPDCKELVKHKQGSKRQFFSHFPDSKCRYAEDKDYKSDWHIKMQEFFPKENREIYIWNKDRTEYRRADVYLPESNMVLEFQHSPIKDTEFWYRTLFYMQNGIRIVWLYDEESQKREFGRFKLDNEHWRKSSSKNKWYKWLNNPRTYVPVTNGLIINSVSICVYTGTEGDVFHRVIDGRSTYDWTSFEFAEFSLNDINMEKGMDVEQFFICKRELKERVYHRGWGTPIV